jgi:hypothetical protein
MPLTKVRIAAIEMIVRNTVVAPICPARSSTKEPFKRFANMSNFASSFLLILMTTTKGLKEPVKDCDAEHAFGETNHVV